MLKKMRVIDYNLLKSEGVTFNRLDLNKLIKYPTENWKHFAVKSQRFYMPRTMNHDVLTEFEITGFGVVIYLTYLLKSLASTKLRQH